MPDRSGHARQHRTPRAIRRPRVPAGERLVREHGWLTSDHPQACWYRVISHSADWSQVRLHVTAVLDADAVAFDVVVRPDGYVVPQRTDAQLGAEAIRIIATAIRAGQRNTDD
ncbi:MAG: hypothetical protein ABI901_06285 [Roseiflexaceae bacterium]